MTSSELVLIVVVGFRFLLPLAILRYPLPAILACLVLDAVDQTIFQALGYDPPGYQSYDKAMDVFYLAIAYLATMRNWRSAPAYQVGRFLYFYRLVGVVVFELTHARPLLLVFCNTFEYFFIAYEGIRLRWRPSAYALRWWATVAASIWVLVKLPQEYWLHIAKLDVTDVLSEHAWAPPLLVAILAAGLAVIWFVVRPRLPRPDHVWHVSADPMPREVDSGAEQAVWLASYGRVWSMATIEKIVLVGLLAVVYAKTLPGIRTTEVQLFTGIALVVVLNSALSLAMARREWTIESVVLAFVARTLLNVGVVVAADVLLGRSGGSMHPADTLFFLTLISLITTLHDRYQAVQAHLAESSPTLVAPGDLHPDRQQR